MNFLAPSSRSRRRKEADASVATDVRRWIGRRLVPSASSRRRLRLQWRRARGWRLSLSFSDIEFPKQLPISALHRLNIRIARNDCATIRPINLPLHQFGAHWIRQRVKAKAGKSIASAFFLAQNVIMWLMLPFAATAQRWFEVCAQKLYGVELVTFPAHSHPNEMQMVRHQAVGRTKEPFPHGCVQHQFAKPGVKCQRQPTPCSFLQRIRPKHHRMALVSVPFQSWKLTLLRRNHGAGMESSACDVKRPRSRRRKEADSSVATDVRRWKSLASNRPPHVVHGLRLLTSAATL